MLDGGRDENEEKENRKGNRRETWAPGLAGIVPVQWHSVSVPHNHQQLSIMPSCECQQDICCAFPPEYHPSLSVWHVCCLHNTIQQRPTVLAST